MNRISLARIVLFLCVAAVVTVAIRSVQSHREAKKAEAAALVEQEKAEVARREAEAAAKAEREKAEIAAKVEQQKAESVAQAAREKAKAARREAEARAIAAAREMEEQNRQRAAEEAAAEHGRFLNKYVNTNLTWAAESQKVAVAVVSESGTMNHAIGTALATRFKSDRVELTTSFFKPELVTDGLFASLFNGSSELSARLELAKSIDALILARQEVRYETNRALSDLITATMQLEIATLPVAGASESRSWTLTANGAGVRATDARMNAEERIVKQITTDTNLTLNLRR